MRFPKRSSILSLLLMFVFIVGCNKEQKQYNSISPKAKGKDERAIIENNIPVQTGDELKNGGQGENKVDEQEFKEKGENESSEQLTQESSTEEFDPSLEIFIDSGALGLTFDSTVDDAFKHLGPYQDVNNNNGVIITNYKKRGLLLTWSTDSVNKLLGFTFTSPYKGAINFGGSSGMIGIGTNIVNKFGTSELTEIIKEIYRTSQNKPVDFDCLKTGNCGIVPTKTVFTLIIENIKLVINRLNAQVVVIQVENPIMFNELNPEVDLLKPRVSLESGKSFSLGEKWGNVKDKINRPTQPRTEENGFVLNYGKISFLVSKSNSKDEYKNPSGDELLGGIKLDVSYKRPLLFAGEYLDSETMKFGKAVEFPFGMNTSFTKENYVEKMQLLEKRIYGRLKLQDPDATVVTKLYFLNTKSDLLKVVLEALSWNSERSKGHSITIGFDKILKKIDVIRVNSVTNVELFKRLGLSTKELISLKDKEQLMQLAGFKIGDEIKLVNFNPAIGDGKLILPKKGEYPEVSEQVGVEVNSNRSGMYMDGNGTIETNPVVKVSIPNYGTTLDIKVMDRENLVYQVFGVASEVYYGGFTNICGDENFAISASDKVSEVKEKIANHKVSSNYSENDCPVYMLKNGNGSGEIESVYFPKYQMMIQFLNNEIAKIVIYSRAPEAKQ